eukprot:6404643-Prymnesium_polylepis.1
MRALEWAFSNARRGLGRAPGKSDSTSPSFPCITTASRGRAVAADASPRRAVAFGIAHRERRVAGSSSVIKARDTHTSNARGLFRKVADARTSRNVSR